MAKHKKKLQICLIASAGGHLQQLLKLADSWKKYNTFYVSTVDIVAKKLQEYGPVYIVGECNRQHPLKSLLVLVRCIKIILKLRPNVVISTGAAPGFFMCITAIILGARVVWVDSIANVEQLSLSGRMIRPFSDLFLTQWPELAKKYKNLEYVGTVI